MDKLKIYKESPSIFQKYIALTNQKQILIDRVCREIEANIKSSYLSFLDIGCADGVVTLQIIDRLKESFKLEVTAIEASKKLINQFKDSADCDINYINGNVELINQFPKSDFILISHVVSYINDLDVFLGKVIESLNTNGFALIVVSNDNSDDKRVKDILKKDNSKETISDTIDSIFKKKKIKSHNEVIESEIDVSGIEDMNENGKTIVEFLLHKNFEDISENEIKEIRRIIQGMANENKKLTKRENYIWLFK